MDSTELYLRRRGHLVDRERSHSAYERRERIKAVLMKYCDPKPECDGVTAWEIAGKILEEMEK